MRSHIILIAFAFILLSCNLISAEIMLFQPDYIYNFGDNINVAATVKPNMEKSGFLQLYLFCGGNSSRDFHKEFISLKSGEEKEIKPTPLPITRAFFGNQTRECKIIASFSDELAETPLFEVSDTIDVRFGIENTILEPGQNLIISGEARKLNEKPVEGYIDVLVDKFNIAVTRDVKNGTFNTNITIPTNTKADSYEILAKVYEKDKDGYESNKGTAQAKFRVKQKPTRIEIAVESLEFQPGNPLKFQPVIQDQAGDPIGGEILVKIYNPNETKIYEEILKSNYEFNFNLTTDAPSGYWTIEGAGSGLTGKRTVYVEKYEQAEFILKNSSLVIKNIGNVVYKKAIQIIIGEEKQIKDIEIPVGGAKEYLITAPDGEYEVKLTDGTVDYGEKLFLTGKAISIKEAGSRSAFSQYSLTWMFIIAVFGIFILLLVQRVIKKKSYSYPVKEQKIKSGFPENKNKDLSIPADYSKKIQEYEKQPSKNIFSTGIIPSNIKNAEYTLVLNGKKEEASLLALKIKSPTRTKKIVQETLSRIKNYINENKGVLYEKDDMIIALFSPTLTKTLKNEINAINLAQKIESVLKEHNRKFRDKIDFGLALNTGPIVIKTEPDLAKFTSLANTLSMSKKLSDISNNNFIVSESSFKNVRQDIKAQKKTLEGLNVYQVEDIIQKDNYKKFIGEFLKRQEAGE